MFCLIFKAVSYNINTLIKFHWHESSEKGQVRALTCPFSEDFGLYTLVYSKWLQKGYKNYFSLRSGQSFRIYQKVVSDGQIVNKCIVSCWLKLQFQGSCSHWASFIQLFAETILEFDPTVISQICVRDSWTYSMHWKRTYASLSEVKSMN